MGPRASEAPPVGVRSIRMNLRVAALFSFALLTFAACARAPGPAPVTSTPKPEVRPAAPASAAPSAPGSSSAPIVEADLAPFAPSPLTPGPIKVRGYPHTVQNGMNDPAQWFGWTRDGAHFSYCAEVGATDIPVLRCELLGRDGARDARGGMDKGFPSEANNRAARQFIADERLTKIDFSRGFTEALPPPLTGTWAYPDIELAVLRVAATESKTDPSGFAAPAVVRLGGVVTGEPAAVYPITLTRADELARKVPAHFAVMNGMALSPDGADLGVVAHFFACEYCDFFVAERYPVARLAGLVYNDAGFARHRKGEYARAAELFAKASFADPAAKLPPYNLACALARLGDARAAAALDVAIARGGATVKERARGDADFASVRDAAWFVERTR